MTKRIHADAIHAWADGAKIEWSKDGRVWQEIEHPSWNDFYMYRVKREPVLKWIALYEDEVSRNYYDTLEQAKQVRPSAINYVQVQVSP